MKIDKKALSSLSFILILVGMWNAIFLFDQSAWTTDNLIQTLILDASMLFLVTEDGYKKLRKVLGLGLKILPWVLGAVIVGLLCSWFSSLPPMTIIIVLLLLILFKN